MILIGNKIDLPKIVHTDEGKKLAKDLKLTFYETSAKDNSGVTQAIGTLVSDVVKDMFEQKTRPSSQDNNNIIDLRKGLSTEGDTKCLC